MLLPSKSLSMLRCPQDECIWMAEIRESILTGHKAKLSSYKTGPKKVSSGLSMVLLLRINGIKTEKKTMIISGQKTKQNMGVKKVG